MSAFADFERIARPLAPRAAVVLGSGLGDVAAEFRESASIPFGDVPNLAPPTVHGHSGRVVVGLWGATPTLLFLGRLHFYEGHNRDVVTGIVRVAADLGVKRLILTNAAGGIHPNLGPGSLMAIRGHFKLLGPAAWRALAAGNALATPYSPHLLALMSDLFAGVYAALTGPCYETPAEIRALAACGADAVGMSTALEAEEAAKRGMEVAAISCITNKAAGLGAGTLDHGEVLANARLAVERMRDLLTHLVES
jgi:purine-nucleoside phosphorylase